MHCIKLCINYNYMDFLQPTAGNKDSFKSAMVLWCMYPQYPLLALMWHGENNELTLSRAMHITGCLRGFIKWIKINRKHFTPLRFVFGGKVVSESTSAQCDRRERKPPAACSLLSSNSGLIEPLSALSVSVFVFKLKERQRETFIEISADRESIGIL